MTKRYITLLGLTASLAAGPGAADVAAGRTALAAGRWADAEREFKSAPPAQKAASLLGLGELCLTTGRLAEAGRHASAAAALPASKSAGLCLLGEVQRETGRTAEAGKSLAAALAADPRNLRARVFLGMVQHETGQAAAAARTLGAFSSDIAAGKLDTKRADHLTYAGMALVALKSWQEANEALQDAVERDPLFLQANVEWGDLFLMKYRADEAAKCYGDVLKANPNHPRALVGMARVRLETAYDVPKATKLADQALANNPACIPALALKAAIALDDEAFGPAEDLLKRALAVNPVDLESLALFAASRYLQDDMPGYEAHRQKALRQNPRFSGFYFVVAELAVRHHRYADAVRLYRQAVALDPRDADALAGLGTNLLRQGVGGEVEALKVLDRAFDSDGFNVRTFNTLNLYEEIIAKEYQTAPAGAFVFRFSKKEAPLLTRFVPRLMERAWAGYVKKYGFTPTTPVTVELFTERQHYGARTTGLPEIGAQGTCFGQLITAMSPSSAEASWEQVLWHELAHVFHLQLSKNRVPRWFTEGLAEYETNTERPYWKREHAREIYLSLRRGNLWKIGELSAAFTRPDRPNGVVIAYQQSSLVIHYLAETAGFPKLVEALRLYGQGKRDAEVLTAITGKPVETLDREFQDFLRKRYPHYEKGFLFDEAAHVDVTAAKLAAEVKPTDTGAQADYAAALLEEDPAAAAEAARRAIKIDPKHVLARFVLAQSLLQGKDVPAAASEFRTLLDAGTDGFAIRLGLGRAAAAQNDTASAVTHLNAAKGWDPDGAEPYVLLMQLYERLNRREDLLRETEAYLDLEEHDHEAARLLIDRLAADRRWPELERVAGRAVGITPMEPFVHQQYGTALAALGRPKEAIEALETALTAGVRRPGPVRGLLARQYLLAGNRTRARELAEQALKETPGNADAQAVLQAPN